MTSDLLCISCQTPRERDDCFCVHCGQTTAQIAWSASSNTRPGKEGIVISPGETFYIVAHNAGNDSVRVSVDIARLRGLRILGSSEKQVAGNGAAAFTLQHLAGEAIIGFLQLISEDGPRLRPAIDRPQAPWWEVRAKRSLRRAARELARVNEERWVVGSSALLFPPGVRRQYVHIWNDADQERIFDSEVPTGYRVTNYSVSLDRKSPSLLAHGDMELTVEAEPERAGQQSADREWNVGPEPETIPIHKLKAAFGETGADVVVAIDFGTRNTGVRVRWRHGLVSGKPRDTVDVIGDRDGHARFPTEMALHRKGRTFKWGSEVPKGLLSADEIRIENLKTYLRVGEDHYMAENPRWTNAYLLESYFVQLFARLDEYFRTADPESPLSRSELNIRYVLTRPVLDANDGDGQGSRDARGREYERALTLAMQRCGVPEEQITFVHEPVAAAFGIARRRAKDLLALGEGAAIAVVDAGGGTTDIALARVSFRNGQPALNIRGSYALNLDAASPALPAVQRYGTQDRLEFGGDVLDYALTYRLLTDASALLETDGRPVPPRLEVSATPLPLEEPQRRETEFVRPCRQMKEDFAHVSAHYLTRSSQSDASPGRAMFANRPEYEGITLEHPLVGEHIVAPILQTPVEDLRERMEQDGYDNQGLRPEEIKQVFYVGGTNIDFYVREQFQIAFPNSPRITQEASEGREERISERLNAVIEGAVWYDEALFAASPLLLTLRLGEIDRPLLQKGDPLPPADAPKTHRFPIQLEPFQELEVALIASGGGLPEPVDVAKGFYRNTSETPQEGMLLVRISREKGAIAVLQLNNRDYKQWQFLLVEAA